MRYAEKGLDAVEVGGWLFGVCFADVLDAALVALGP